MFFAFNQCSFPDNILISEENRMKYFLTAVLMTALIACGTPVSNKADNQNRPDGDNDNPDPSGGKAVGFKLMQT